MQSFTQEIKNYLDRRFGKESSFLHSIRTQSQKENLPGIQIPIHVGRILQLLVKIQCPKKVLEIGTLGGYSTAWIAEALRPASLLLSIEANLYHAAKAREHLLPLKEKNIHIEIRVGQGVELLPQIDNAQEGPFDLIFIDADKENVVLYLDWSIQLSRPGSLIVIDNLIPKGPKVGLASNHEAAVMYEFNDYLAQHPSLEVSVIPTLAGTEARLDALAVAIVR